MTSVEAYGRLPAVVTLDDLAAMNVASSSSRAGPQIKFFRLPA